MTDADPVNPMRIFHELSERLPDNAIVVERLRQRGELVRPAPEVPRRHPRLAVRHPGDDGPGVPYAIGAKWAHPDRPAIALVGDGAMQMNGLAELITIAQYWQQWADPRLIVAVLHNNDLNQVTWEMRAMEGAPEVRRVADPARRRLRRLRPQPRPGRRQHRRPRRARARPGTAALSADRPTVLDVRCDPDVPPIPPHATFEQVKAVAGAVLHGDEDAWGFVKQGVKQKVQQYLPGTKDGES